MRTSKDVVGGSVCNAVISALPSSLKEKTYSRSIVTDRVGLYPYNVFTPSEPPSRKNLSPSLQAVSGSAPYPQQNERGIGGEGGYGQILKIRP